MIPYEKFDPLGTLPSNLNDQDAEETFYEDSRALKPSHYVMAERCIQVEYATIKEQIETEPSSDTLTYILEGGFRGFHKMGREELVEEYKQIEEQWYNLYEVVGLPWEPYDDDPILSLEMDENGEVEKG